MAKNKKEIVKAVDTNALAADALKNQYSIVIAAEKTCFRERVKFGLMLIDWERFLGESRGRGNEGEGLKGWLEKNCPNLGYASAMGYKVMAERALKMLGGGAVVTAALLGEGGARQPDGEIIDVPCEVSERCDRFFAAVDSRRKLEQMWFSFVEGEERGSRKRKAAAAAAAAGGLSNADAATVMWAAAMEPFGKNRAAFHSAARDLPLPVARKHLAELEMLVDALKARLEK